LHVLSVVGARPNLPKIAPLVHELTGQAGIRHTLVHTGQHYDRNLSQVFFDELRLPPPDVRLGVGSGSHAVQTARAMVAFERVLGRLTPDVVVVVGDVNSTLACALTAARLGIPVAHVEAGLRSFDRTMPEEINRIVADAVSDLLFTPCRRASRQLRAEGVAAGRIFLVGNLMIDSLRRHHATARALHTPARLGLGPGRYGLLSAHRPANVDDPEVLGRILDAVDALQRDVPIVFPVHPRTRRSLTAFRYRSRLAAMKNLLTVEPLGYLPFLDLMTHARFVLTDSGGVQAETTVLGVPCLTLRETTEYTVTTARGTNRLVGTDPARIVAAANAVLAAPRERRRRHVPPLWDGRAARRVVTVLRRRFSR
jgi:UDP-N-acetylglucosamine 2-epimerase (non-hydrolysing)